MLGGRLDAAGSEELLAVEENHIANRKIERASLFATAAKGTGIRNMMIGLDRFEMRKDYSTNGT